MTFLESSPPPILRICDRFPDVELTNQFGESFRFRERFVRDGSALVVNTMFTTCRGSCPGTTAKLQKLRKTLAPVFGKRLRFVSLTLEPEVDTPDVLWNYAAMFKAVDKAAPGPEWHFLTGSADSINRLRRSLGFFDLNPQVDADVSQHASTLLVGNCTSDRWASLAAELRDQDLLSSIRRIAGFSFQDRYGISP